MKTILKKYFNSVLSPDEFERFCEFVKSTKNSKPLSEMMKLEWNYFYNDQDADKSNPALLERIKQRILVEDRQKLAKVLRMYSVGIRVAAVLVVGLIITSIWLFQNPRLSTQAELMQTVEIPLGARTQMQLPDGSQVWLNSGSTLSFSNDFARSREVDLEGEAFFDVVKSKVPFEIHTDYGDVKVLGTAFNVDAYPDEEFSTTLERGKIEFSSNTEEKKILEPGEQVRIVGDKIVLENVDTQIFTSWRQGRLIFKREPFPSMIKKLERWYNVQIQYSASDFDGLWFSGTVEGESISEVMEMVCKSAPVKYNYNSRTRTIQIK
ncbi:FecR family protein [Mangrovibacterium lignilyticum]|uniref:FecR family protein n=1 Tax=Mangrovibacterium lignilyticum TaxID=2668052 RepID=UPI0013D2A339|nr:FecR domain-containing protein [Mangrovibacterium lignilyticum]